MRKKECRLTEAQKRELAEILAELARELKLKPDELFKQVIKPELN